MGKYEVCAMYEIGQAFRARLAYLLGTKYGVAIAENWMSQVRGNMELIRAKTHDMHLALDIIVEMVTSRTIDLNLDVGKALMSAQCHSYNSCLAISHQSLNFRP